MISKLEETGRKFLKILLERSPYSTLVTTFQVVSIIQDFQGSLSRAVFYVSITDFWDKESQSGYLVIGDFRSW
jgi:hypothetical protein